VKRGTNTGYTLYITHHNFGRRLNDTTPSNHSTLLHPIFHSLPTILLLSLFLPSLLLLHHSPPLHLLTLFPLLRRPRHLHSKPTLPQWPLRVRRSIQVPNRRRRATRWDYNARKVCGDVDADVVQEWGWAAGNAGCATTLGGVEARVAAQGDGGEEVEEGTAWVSGCMCVYGEKKRRRRRRMYMRNITPTMTAFATPNLVLTSFSYFRALKSWGRTRHCISVKLVPWSSSVHPRHSPSREENTYTYVGLESLILAPTHPACNSPNPTTTTSIIAPSTASMLIRVNRRINSPDTTDKALNGAAMHVATSALFQASALFTIKSTHPKSTPIPRLFGKQIRTRRNPAG
jgi:hypothetical protein